MCVILSAAKDLKCFAEVRLLRYYTVLSVEIPRRLGMTENGCSNHHFAYKKHLGCKAPEMLSYWKSNFQIGFHLNFSLFTLIFSLSNKFPYG